MPVRKESIPLGGSTHALNESLEDLGHGIDDGRVRKVRDADGISSRKLRFYDGGEVTVGATQIAVPHNLGAEPHFVVITMRTVGTIYESARADSSRVWLTADAAGRRAHVLVFA